MVKNISDNVVEIISLDEFISIVSKYEGKGNVFFRGQKDKEYNISCSLSRDEGYVKNENNMILDTLENKPREFEVYKTPIEILSKMQHYEIPTRLVDITINPYIALYFAIEEAEHVADAEIFIFEKKPYAINSKDINLVSLLAVAEDYSFQALIELYKETYSEEITEDEIIEIIEENKLVEFNEFLSHTNERLYNQKGTFILCTNVVENNIIMNQVKEISRNDVSFTIRVPVEYKNRIKDELNIKYNINRYILYIQSSLFSPSI